MLDLEKIHSFEICSFILLSLIKLLMNKLQQGNVGSNFFYWRRFAKSSFKSVWALERSFLYQCITYFWGKKQTKRCKTYRFRSNLKCSENGAQIFLLVKILPHSHNLIHLHILTPKLTVIIKSEKKWVFKHLLEKEL